MVPDELIYVPRSELDRLRAVPPVAFPWFVSGFAAGLIFAVLIGWAT